MYSVTFRGENGDRLTPPSKMVSHVQIINLVLSKDVLRIVNWWSGGGPVVVHVKRTQSSFGIRLFKCESDI